MVNRGPRSVISKCYFIVHGRFRTQHVILKIRNATKHLKKHYDIIQAIRKHQTFQVAISSAETRDKSVSRILLRNGWTGMHSSYTKGEFSSPPTPDWFAVNPTTLLAGNTLNALSRVKRLKSLNHSFFIQWAGEEMQDVSLPLRETILYRYASV
jgi:hypothetical protein